jgi:hypothetical protein
VGSGQKGEGGEPITRLTQLREAAMQPGDSSEEAVVVKLSVGSAQA